MQNVNRAIMSLFITSLTFGFLSVVTSLVLKRDVGSESDVLETGPDESGQSLRLLSPGAVDYDGATAAESCSLQQVYQRLCNRLRQ